MCIRDRYGALRVRQALHDAALRPVPPADRLPDAAQAVSAQEPEARRDGDTHLSAVEGRPDAGLRTHAPGPQRQGRAGALTPVPPGSLRDPGGTGVRAPAPV